MLVVAAAGGWQLSAAGRAAGVLQGTAALVADVSDSYYMCQQLNTATL